MGRGGHNQTPEQRRAIGRLRRARGTGNVQVERQARAELARIAAARLMDKAKERLSEIDETTATEEVGA